MKGNMPNYISVLNGLKKVFEYFEVPDAMYSLYGITDKSICFEEMNGMFFIYYNANGKKNKIAQYMNILEACIDMINRVASSPVEVNKMERMFYNLINSYDEELVNNNTMKRG